MKIFATLSIFGLVAFSSVPLYSQGKDYIVKMDGDTLRGLIKPVDKRTTSIEFKANGSDGFVTYTPGDITSFAYGSILRFKSLSLENNKIFSQILVEGQVSLYAGSNVFFVEKNGTIYKLTKKDSVMQGGIKEDKKYTGILSAVMDACDGMQGKFPSVKFTSHSLSKIVAEYNTCVNPAWKPTVYKEKKVGRAVIGAKFGMMTTEMSFPVEGANFYGVDFTSVSSGAFGIFVNLPLTRRLSMQPEIFFTRKGGDFTGRTITPNPSSPTITETQDAHYDVSYMQVPLTLKYSFGNGKIKPYLMAGAVYGMVISKDAWKETTIYTGGYDEELIYFVPSEMGYRLGIGANYLVFNKAMVGVEYYYERTIVDPGAASERYRHVTHAVAVSIGYVLGQ